MEIGEICNYYGGLNIVEKDGKYYWWIEDYHESTKQEIPKYLYDALIKFNTENERS